MYGRDQEKLTVCKYISKAQQPKHTYIRSCTTVFLKCPSLSMKVGLNYSMYSTAE